MSMRKGVFPTDGIARNNLKIPNKSLQQLGKKTPVPHRAKATMCMCAFEYNCVQWASVHVYS